MVTCRAVNVWLLQTWEPNPVDDPNGRLWRTGSLARRLLDQGHSVTWWASRFHHHTKQMRAPSPGPIPIEPGYRVFLMDAIGYRKHISFRRLRDYRHVANSFAQLAPGEPEPDVIVASYPTIETCSAALAYARPRGIPVLVDVRDQYPDVFWQSAPAPLRPLVKVGCRKLAREASEIFRDATGITGNGPGVIGWALQCAHRVQQAYDRSVYMSYQPPEVSPEQRASASAHWDAHGLHSDQFIATFAGSLGKMFDFSPVLNAARDLREHPEIVFVICGQGSSLDTLREQARDLPNIRFTGWVTPDRLRVLLERSAVGLAPYRPLENFERSITNKPVEYLSYGLPVLTSLQHGELPEILSRNHCGRSYLPSGPQSLSRMLAELQENPGLQVEMGAAATRTFRALFHPDQVYGEWIKLIEQVVAETASSRSLRRP